MKALFLVFASGAVTGELFNEAFDGKVSEFSFSECGKSSSCMALQSNCKSGEAGCAIASWSHQGDKITVGLEDTEVADNSWVAIGFAPTKTMANADIYYCRKSAETIAVVSAFSPQNTRPTDDVAGTGIEVTSVGTSSSASTFSCSFSRPISVMKNNIEFKLDDGNTFFVLLARGSGGSLEAPGYHGAGKIASPEGISFSEDMEAVFPGAPVQEGELLNEAFDGKISEFSFSECGKSASCMALKPNCTPGESGCAVASWSHQGDTIAIGLEDTEVAGNSWVAIGFAPTKTMANADIYYCRNSPETTAVVSAFAPQNTRPTDDAAGTGIEVTSVGTSASGSTFSCSFSRPISVMKNNIEFKLDGGNTFFILLARGSGGSLEAPGYHGAEKTASTGGISFSEDMELVFLGGTVQKNSLAMVKAHASLMFFAWSDWRRVG